MRIISCALLALAAVLPTLASAATMQCAPFQITQAVTATYTADAAGVVTAVGGNDVTAMHKGGCDLVGIAGNTMIGRLLGANMNATTDQPIPLFVSNSFRITKITVKNASTSLTTAVGGFYPAASKGGTAIVLNNQAYSGLTTGALALDLTIDTVPAATVYAATQGLWLALTTAQGAAATADIFVFGEVGK
jgi:hypothetical protein